MKNERKACSNPIITFGKSQHSSLLVIRRSNPRNLLSKTLQRGAKDGERKSRYRAEMNMPLENEIRAIFR